jgi:septum formation protein
MPALGCPEILKDGEPPADAVMRLAELKAESVYSRLVSMGAAEADENGGILVLGADTLVFLDGAPLGKPRDRADAAATLKSLCGRVHEVYTGVCFVFAGKKLKIYEKTYVAFGAFDDKIVYNYIESGKPFDKAGGYGVQDAEIRPLIKGIDGDADNVIGLPVAAVLKILKEKFV